MQKFKVVASKSQKKYTIILSAETENDVKERLHKDDYSILSVTPVGDEDIKGERYLFQAEKNGEVKTGIIIGDDVFKIYIKLTDELGYNVISLYPEADKDFMDSVKKEEIMEKLRVGYKLRKKETKTKEEKQTKEESFYMKKKLDETYILINKAVGKFENIFSNKAEFEVDDETFYKLEQVYEKLIHIKSSTNYVKLQEVGELALSKIAEIELQSLEKNKSKKSKELLGETNKLLKQIGSSKQFIEEDKDYKKKLTNFLHDTQDHFSLEKIKKELIGKKKKKSTVDTQSYSHLKTILLLDTYKEKLQESNKEVRSNITKVYNPFHTSELKDKILIKRNVIKQNISLLHAKKNGGVSSYTTAKKGMLKVYENTFNTFSYISENILFWMSMYIFLILGAESFGYLGVFESGFRPEMLLPVILMILIFILFKVSKNIFMLAGNLALLSFLFIFSQVNF